MTHMSLQSDSIYGIPSGKAARPITGHAARKRKRNSPASTLSRASTSVSDKLWVQWWRLDFNVLNIKTSELTHGNRWKSGSVMQSSSFGRVVKHFNLPWIGEKTAPCRSKICHGESDSEKCPMRRPMMPQNDVFQHDIQVDDHHITHIQYHIHTYIYVYVNLYVYVYVYL